jgi:orotidine-5'-phosphate decarboxylase
MADAFATRFATVRTRFGPLVWGLDPSGSLLETWGVGDTPDGLDRFADIALQAAAGTVGLVKLQAAFYERHGWRGFRTLQRLIAEAQGAGLLVIVDAKRGDVGSTNDAYAEAFLGADAPLGADALTVHPYLGLGAMGAFISRAHEAGSCLLVVTRSSNPEGRVVQAATDPDGRTVEAGLLVAIGELNARLAPGEIGPIGAVVGPISMDPPLDLVAPQGLFLAPGVGVQGATPHDVARVFAACPERVMPSASRSLLGDSPEVGRLRDAVGRLADVFREALAVPAGRGIV